MKNVDALVGRKVFWGVLMTIDVEPYHENVALSVRIRVTGLIHRMVYVIVPF